MSYSSAHALPVRRDANIKTWQLFFLILLVNVVLAWVYNNVILTREVYYNLLSEQLDTNRIDEYFDFTRKLSVWGYMAQPLLFWLQITFFALLIQMPLVFMFIEIPFVQIFRVVALASMTSTLLSMTQLLRLSFYHASEITQTTLETIPLSLANLVNPYDYPKSALLVLGKFNLFEVLWCIILCRGLATTGQIKKNAAMILVVIVWIMLLLFQWGMVAYFDSVSS